MYFVLQAHAHERVGVICKRNGSPSVVEYSEISKEMAEQTDAESGALVFGAGNIGLYCYQRKFLEEVTNAGLQYVVLQCMVFWV